MRKGIASKLITIIVILVVVSVSSVGLFTYIRSSKIIKDNFINSNYELNREIATSIDKEFQGYMNGLKMVAESSNTRSIPEKGFDVWRQDVFKSYLNSFGSPFQVFIGLPDGKIFIEPYYKFDDSYDPRKRGWYMGVDSTKSDFWTGVYTDAVTGAFAVSAATPVMDISGKQVGILGTSIKLDDLSEKIASIEVGKEGYVFILDKDNLVVAHPNKDLRGTPLDIPEISQVIEDGKTDGVVYYDYVDAEGNHAQKYAVYQKVEGLDWYVMTSMYLSEVSDQTAILVWYTILGGIFITIIAVIIGLGFAQKITTPLRKLAVAADEIASGKLDVEIDVKTNDETGNVAKGMTELVKRLENYILCIDEISEVLFNISRGDLIFELKQDYVGAFEKIKLSLEEISNELRSTLSQIAVASDEVSSGSEQVAGGAQALSQGATEQASSIQELSASISEVSDRIKKSAEGAAHAKEIANESSVNVQKGNSYMQNMVSAMEEINATSNEIGSIIKTIDDIAFQTNILALNAAVEAARAGSAGKGFAVVADEVRTLASKSAESAKNTSALIEKALLAVQNGMNIAEQTAEVLGNIVEGSEKSAIVIEEISNNAIEQADSVSQINIGVSQISSVVQNNSATAEESAAASEELSGQAQMLKDLVGKFNI